MVARRQNEPVMVASLTTPTRKVSAKPDGSFVAELTTQPVRALRDGTWVPIDATLATRPDVASDRRHQRRYDLEHAAGGLARRPGGMGGEQLRRVRGLQGHRLGRQGCPDDLRLVDVHVPLVIL